MTFDVSMSSSLSKVVSHVWVSGVEEGDWRGEGVRPVACRKWGCQFSTWDQSGARFAPCNDGHCPK
jgi:hypothetical protein